MVEVIENEKQSILIIRIKVKINKGRNGCTKNGNTEIEKGLETIKVNAEEKDKEINGNRQNIIDVEAKKEQMIEFIPSSWHSK